MAALLYVPSHGFLPLLLVAAVQGVASSALNPLIDSLALALVSFATAQRNVTAPPWRSGITGPGEWGTAAFHSQSRRSRTP